jgi:hypothetical protein
MAAGLLLPTASGVSVQMEPFTMAYLLRDFSDG